MILSTSERIKELREKNGYTQAALAAKLSVTRACVNRNWSTETRSEKRSLSANQSVFERTKFFSS